MTSVSAVVCTRNRGAMIAESVCSILANRHPAFELVVVDQSPNDETAAAMQPHLRDPRVRYVRTATVGLGLARNLGLEAASADIVAMTDDDCEAAPDWLCELVDLFERNPRAAVAFCSVEAGPHDPAAGFVPAYRPPGERKLTHVRDFCAPHGIGAGMAVRKSIVCSFGGFDGLLGAGARFPSYEDADIALRALLFGFEVHEMPAATVVHHGFRTWRQGRDLGRRDYIGVGAGHAKLLKGGCWAALRSARYEVGSYVIGPILREALRLRRPTGVNRGIAFARGFAAGIRTPVDRSTLTFRAS